MLFRSFISRAKVRHKSISNFRLFRDTKWYICTYTPVAAAVFVRPERLEKLEGGLFSGGDSKGSKGRPGITRRF